MIKIFNIDFDKLQFNVNWKSALIIFGLLSSSIYFYQDNIKLKGTILSTNSIVKSQTEQITQLRNQLNELNGTTKTMSQAVQIFMENSPSELKYRIEHLENFHIPDLITGSTHSDTFNNRVLP